MFSLLPRRLRPEEFVQREFTVPQVVDPSVEQEMVDILEGTSDLSNRVSDIKNRMELHRMLAEYEQHDRLSQQAEPSNFYEVVNDDESPAMDYEEMQAQQPPFFQRSFRRAGPNLKEANDERLQDLLTDLRAAEELQGQPQRSSFREVAQGENPASAQGHQMDEEAATNFFNGRNEHHRRQFDYEDADASDYPTVYLSPRDQLVNFRDDSPDEGVYTEGGIVYAPGSSKNDATQSLLQSIMGFTRHERLDVKKPGPQPPQPPPSSLSPHETPKVDNRNLEQLPPHMKSDEPPKIKKQVHDKDLDHANYSVDTEYAHVILKNSIDSWTDGVS
jgi:receptor-type tyrosine-protein phosphatase N